MDNFDKIIKEKVEQFDVSFNETHWAEMEGRLNQISSNRTRNIIFGSAATVITLLISGYFLFSLDSNSKVEPKITTPSLNSIKTKPVSSAPTNTVIAEPIQKITPIAIAPKENIIKTKPVNKPIVNHPKKETSTIAVSVSTEKPIESNTKVETKEKLNAPITNSIKESTSKKEVIPSIEKPTSITETQNATSKEELPAVSPERIKKIRHRAYEDENVSKKSIKRRSRSIFSFLSFKKRLYKVPLSRKKSSKKKK